MSTTRLVSSLRGGAGALPVTPASGPGYHTLVAPGTPVRDTRVAADLALVLMADGGAEQVERARQIIGELVSLQVTDPGSEHYGLWGWFAEEPPAQMAPADWNWAAFIGVRLAHLLALHAEALGAPTAAAAATALEHACASIVRRDVGPDYTNIAVMSAVVCAAAGELLAQPALLADGRARLGAVVELADRTGGVSEYSSPTYAHVALTELERAHMIVTDAAFLGDVERLRVLEWELLAERYHPATGQIAGPMSRAYGDRLPPQVARYLAAQAGAETDLRDAVDDDTPDVVTPLPAPAHLRQRFRTLPTDGMTTSSVVKVGRAGPVVGTTWFSSEACLGSADREYAWAQRRPLLGYWRTDAERAVVLRAQLLLDGRDLAAAWCGQSQRDNRVLSAWWLSYDSGNFHPVLDRPAGSIFSFSSLVLRISVSGRGVGVESSGAAIALTAGTQRASVYPADATFLDRPVDWRVRHEDDRAAVELVLHEGEHRQLDLHDAPLAAAFGLVVEPRDHDPTGDRPTADHGPDATCWRWDGLEVSSPRTAVAFVD